MNILVSGGFDPVHVGHLRMFQNAKKLGDKLIIILNNDSFLSQKKGYVFMNQAERKEIIEGFSCVDEVFISIDEDLTVIESIKKISENYDIDIFANGGDRRSEDDLPESAICKELGIELLFNIGGDKIQSSSELVAREVKKPWGNYTTFYKSKNQLIKKIDVNPGQSLSLQSHQHRSEIWLVTNGKAKVEIDNNCYNLEKGETIEIPRKSKHRLSNDYSEGLSIVEIQEGEILSENDIIRYEDVYGRK